MPEFEFAENLIWLWSVPAVAVLFILSRFIRRQKLSKIANRENLRKLLFRYSGIKAWVKFLLFAVCLALLVITYANPRAGTKLKDAKREGIDIVVALDISYSMLAEDVKPSRLELAKHSISKLLDKLESDRVGLIIFAGRANVLFPLTSDYGAAKMFLSTIDPEFISEQGTALGAAIDIAVNKFKTDQKQKKALLIISDGENHEDDAVESAENAAENGFVVYTIGMGSPDGAPIPVYRNGEISTYMKDDAGKTVISKLNADALGNIAKAGGGMFVRSYQTEPDLEQFISQIDKMEKSQFESKKFSQYQSKYQYFLIAALILLTIETILTRYKGKIMQILSI
ncbi:MAG: VWA domain-containing protein [Candidatus Kapabacteria bacterium]|nr:VWA domain-containing protein [Candidatus Kapabacteria bacterium]